MRSQLPKWATFLLWAGVVSLAAAQEEAPDPTRLGPQVAERVPDFTLPDPTGKTWTLSSIMGPNGAMLVFYRSANW
jgi:hypothetical protein